MTLTLASGAPLSPLAFGTMQFGAGADAAASRGLYDASRAAGLNHFDTAWVYTGGQSETLLGQFATQERDQLFIATKVAYQGDGSRANITAQFDESRRRLNMDQADLLYLHRFHDESPLEETFETMAELQSKGLIRHIGVSNYAAWQVMKAQAVCARLGTRIDALQPMYNLVKRQAEVELLPMAADQGIAVFPYSPLGGGLLTGKYAAGGTGRITQDARYAARYAPTFMKDAAAELSAIAKGLAVHPATLAVTWAMAHNTHPRPIISAKSAEQLQPSLAALGYILTDDLYARLSALVPSPPPATDRIDEA